MNTTIKAVKKFSWVGLFTLLLHSLLLNSSHAQTSSAPVPEAVAIPRPSQTEINKAEQVFNRFIKTLDADTAKLFSTYPDLLKVQAPQPNTAVIPNLSPRFQTRHEENKQVAAAGNIDILFMGDSITDWWRSDRQPYAGKPVFDQHFGNMKVANFGIAGDTTQGVLYRLQNGEGVGFSPKVVMLMIGTNNTRANTGPEIAEGVGAVVLQLQKNFPATKILLLGVFPRGTPNDPVRQEIATINEIISRLHDNQKVFYRDIGSIFLDEGGNIPRDIMSDGLHPTTKGYELWAKEVKGTLVELM